MKTYAVSYEGYLLVEAKSEAEAEAKANAMLSQSGITNNGETGEWQLTDTTEEE